MWPGESVVQVFGREETFVSKHVDSLETRENQLLHTMNTFQKVNLYIKSFNWDRALGCVGVSVGLPLLSLCPVCLLIVELFGLLFRFLFVCRAGRRGRLTLIVQDRFIIRSVRFVSVSS